MSCRKKKNFFSSTNEGMSYYLLDRTSITWVLKWLSGEPLWITLFDLWTEMKTYNLLCHLLSLNHYKSHWKCLALKFKNLPILNLQNSILKSWCLCSKLVSCGPTFNPTHMDQTSFFNFTVLKVLLNCVVQVTI